MSFAAASVGPTHFAEGYHLAREPVARAGFGSFGEDRPVFAGFPNASGERWTFGDDEIKDQQATGTQRPGEAAE